MNAPRSRRGAVEVAGVACAVLLPIPVLALGGLHIPVPATVERALAPLLPHAATGASEPEGRLAAHAPAKRGRADVGDVPGAADGRPEQLTPGARTRRTRVAGAAGAGGVATPPRGADPDVSGSDDVPRDDAPSPRPDAVPPTSPAPPTAPSGPPANPGSETTTPKGVTVQSEGTTASASAGEDGVTVEASAEPTGDQGVALRATVGESTEVEVTPKGLP